MRTLIQNAKLYYDNKISKQDLLIEDGKFSQVKDSIEPNADSVINAEGKLLAPGLVDVHVHFREPGQTHKETIQTGTLASAHGGFTTVGAMPNVTPVPDDVEKFSKQVELNNSDSLINTLQYAPVTLDEISTELSPIEDLAKLGAFAFSNDGHGIDIAQTMFTAMERIAAINSHLCAHVEDQSLFNHGVINRSKISTRLGLPAINQAAETSQLARDILLAKDTGVHYHVCHISTADSVQLVRLAKDAGINVTAEASPHHLILSDKNIQADDANFKMNPPLRTENDRLALVEGLKDGTIDMVATDHAPHAKDEKNKGFLKSAFGITGIETSFPLMYSNFVETGIISLEYLLDLMATKPADVFNLHNAGKIEIGRPADFTIIDLDSTYEIKEQDFLSKGVNSPFIGDEVNGLIEKTFVAGKCVYEKK
ncbi:dihydroorotase [Companilactobacillus mishanensis]|uniref:dihydroorotase n=1 Tax=Companilactobacillus mishanensis TaxID=2486008 RepID=UPI0012966419|nr:dihydroorotase [Companilactobacillus mishanensis]MQS88406.1 dihydroorotase [Companilactobacillus mishanensis]